MTLYDYKTELAHALHDSKCFGSCFYSALDKVESEWWWAEDVWKRGVNPQEIIDNWECREYEIMKAKSNFYDWVKRAGGIEE
jgi:hypothetical protein